MARPFKSLPKVITALASAAVHGPRVVDELAAATGLSVVQIRRALHRGIEQGFVRHATPSRRARTDGRGPNRGPYQYELTMAGRNHIAARHARCVVAPVC